MVDRIRTKGKGLYKNVRSLDIVKMMSPVMTRLDIIFSATCQQVPIEDISNKAAREDITTKILTHQTYPVYSS